MVRVFRWEDHGPEHAVLYGPEYHTVAAVVTMDCSALKEYSWRVMSSVYQSLNLNEEDTSLPMESIKQRVLIRLGNEIKEKKMDLEQDMSNLLDMLFDEMKRKEQR